jgi:hypothetical protein
MTVFSLSAYAEPVKEHQGRSNTWNKFADNLYSLHQQVMKSHDTYTEEEDGGYGGLRGDLNFYHEVRYYDRKSGRLLSNIKRENKNPDNIHIMELYIYDKKGRIQREYTAAYLPIHRKAPYQTLINIHHYAGELHGYREFDASDDLLFESCAGKYNNTPVRILFDEGEMPDTLSQIPDKTEREAYRACFDGVPKTARPYTNPLKDTAMLH